MVQRRRWRQTLSCAVDAYREMLRLERELEVKVLALTQREQLADNCPRCFGPSVHGKRAGEPDFIACLDANFQQRRHLSASREYDRRVQITPSLFMRPSTVKQWQDTYASHASSVSDDRVVR